MEGYFQAAGAVLLTVILGSALKYRDSQLSGLLTLAVCVMVLFIGVSYLQPVLDFLDKLENLGQLDSQQLSLLLKAVGISLVSEIAVMICTDSGNGALGKALQVLTSGAILWLSLPLFTGLLELIQRILEEI